MKVGLWVKDFRMNKRGNSAGNSLHIGKGFPRLGAEKILSQLRLSPFEPPLMSQ